MNALPRTVLVVLVLLALGGCGNKGPLVLPSAAGETVVPPEGNADDVSGTDDAAVDAPIEPPAEEDDALPAEPSSEPTDDPEPAPEDGNGNG